MKSSLPIPDTLHPTVPATNETPALHSTTEEKHPALSADRVAALRKVQWRHGFSQLGANRRTAPVVRLREHQTHGRGS